MNDQTRKETKDTEEAEMTKENMSERAGDHERMKRRWRDLKKILIEGRWGEAPPTRNEPKHVRWIPAAGRCGLRGPRLAWIATRSSSSSTKVEVAAGEEKKEEDGHSEGEEGREVKLDPESVESAGIEVEGVTQRPAIAKLYVTGAVELNPEKTEMATPLVGGRIDQVFYGVGITSSAAPFSPLFQSRTRGAARAE